MASGRVPVPRGTRLRDGRRVEGRAAVRNIFPDSKIIDVVEDEAYAAAFHICNRPEATDAESAIELCEIFGIQELLDEVAIARDRVPEDSRIAH